MSIPTDAQKTDVPGESLKTRFITGAFWSFVGTVLGQGLGLAASMLASRILGRTGYGQFGMLTSTVTAFGIFAGLGIGVTTTKFLAETRESDTERAGRVLGLSFCVAAVSGGLMALLLLVFADPLASRALSDPGLASSLRICAPLVILNSLAGVQIGALSGFEAFRSIALVSLLRGVVTLPATVVGARHFGLQGAVAGGLVAGMAACWLNQLAVGRELRRWGIRISCTGTCAEIPLLWRFSLPAFMGGVMVAPVLWLTNVLLAMRPGGYGELGLVNAVNQWRLILMTIPAIAANAALPILSDQQSSKGLAGCRHAMDITHRISSLAILPLHTAIIFLSDRIMRLYGTGFAEGGPILAGVVLGVSISAMNTPLGTGIAALGRMWLGFYLNLVWAVFLLCAVGALAPAWGAKSFALGYPVSYLAQLILAYFHLRHTVPRAMLLRSVTVLVYLLLSTALCIVMHPHARLAAALPMTCAGMAVSYTLMSRQTRDRFQRIQIRKAS